MTLSYRGTNYDYTPPTVATASEKGGTYRGCDWRFRNLKKPPVLQPTRNLVYRGVAYQRGSEGGAAATAVREQSRRLFLNRQQNQRQRQQAMLNRSFAEVGLA